MILNIQDKICIICKNKYEFNYIQEKLQKENDIFWTNQEKKYTIVTPTLYDPVNYIIIYKNELVWSDNDRFMKDDTYKIKIASNIIRKNKLLNIQYKSTEFIKDENFLTIK
jgi:hypothetical protein